jgi:uncharacterized Tic20 family protein
MSTKRFMVRTPDGAVSGPHSSAELVQLAAGGTLTPACEVQLDGGSAWHPATKVKGLQFAGRAVPASASPPASSPPASAPAPAAAAGGSNTIPILMHLSVLSGLVIPFGGLVVPLVLWLVNRKDPRLDAQGKEVMNWVIFISIYSAVSAVLILVLVGILLLLVGAVGVIVFAILGAIKASKGEFFRYPMPFRLLK